DDLAPHIRLPATAGVDSRPGLAAPGDDAMTTTAAPEITNHLIERPRLLAELDAAEARGVRAICLVAPAGYGKTVLAEQWARSRHPDAIWHYATVASADVANFADHLAGALAPAFPELRRRVRELVCSSSSSLGVATALAEEFGSCFRRASSEVWVAL